MRLLRLLLLSLACAAAGAATVAPPAAAQRAERRDRDRDRDRDDSDARDDRDQPRFRLDTVVAFDRGGTVDLSLVSGDIVVTAADRGEVRVRAYSDRGPLRFDHSRGSLRIDVRDERSYGGRRRGGSDERMEITVPVGTRVHAGSVSGNVSVRGVRGEVEANSVSGDVDVRDATRRISIVSVSGGARGVQLDGDVRVQSVSGDVTLDDVSGEVEAGTVSGEVALRRIRSDRVRASTTSGEIGYDGAIVRDGSYEFTSHSGDVRLAVPPDARATVSMRTWSGSLDTQIPLQLAPDERNGRSVGSRGRNRRMEFTLNGGGARISAETFSGDVTITRAPSRGPERN